MVHGVESQCRQQERPGLRKLDPNTHARRHDAHLTDGGVGEQPLEVVLEQGEVGAEKERRETHPADRVEPGHRGQSDAAANHEGAERMTRNSSTAPDVQPAFSIQKIIHS